MGNKKFSMCIIMFLVILVFGIVGPDLSNRQGNTKDEYTTTERVDSIFDTTQTSNPAEIDGSTGMIEDSQTSSDIETSGDTGTSDDIEASDATNTTDITTSTGNNISTETTTEENIEESRDKYVLADDVEEKIDNIIENMTIDEKVGQIFFIKNDGRFDGSILKDYPVGGVILFKGDFVGRSEQNVKDSIQNLQDNSDIPLFIGIDEEGGTVVRLSCYSSLAPYQFRSPRDLYYVDGFDEIKEDTVAKSELLLSYGINVNFAPVCDIPDSNGDFIYTRSFSEDVALTQEYVELVVSVMNDCQIGAVLKHFPGYGNNADTHNSVVRDLRPIEDFEEVDLKPFQSGIDSGAWCVLMNHNIVECMDDKTPASLSKNVHKLLREDMRFGGVIITDDLMMSGITNIYTKEESAVQAVLAGNDMILATDYQVQYEAVHKAIRSGRIKEEQLEESIRRILRWKYTLGLLEF